MAMIWGRPKVELKLGIELSEEEVRALCEVTSYNVDNFLKMFYAHMGQAYLEKYEKGVRLFFETFPVHARLWLRRTDEARKAFEEEQKTHVS